MKSCGECAYKALKDGKCPVFYRDMPVEAPGCPLSQPQLQDALIAAVLLWVSQSLFMMKMAILISFAATVSAHHPVKSVLV